MAQLPGGASDDDGAAAAMVTAAAIALFVATAGSVMPGLLRNLFGAQETVDPTLIIALMLNVALVLMAWRTHHSMTANQIARTDAVDREQPFQSRDALTGFLSRRSLLETGTIMLHDASKRGRSIAVLMLDLDRFKTVNDLHGHAVGDALLARVAAEIALLTPAGAVHARLGSDEFATAFVVDHREPDGVDRIAERLVSRLAQPIEIEGQTVHISASIGLARSEMDRGSIESLLRFADIAMHAAKERGRNQHVWFAPAMAHMLHARNELENGLRAAIPAGQIVPYFEQQVDLDTGRLHGFEVLARWEHPIHGVISPDRFISVAEQTGLITDLSMSLMRQAFLAARDWDPSLSLSVNISPCQLRDAWMPQKIIKLLLETGFPAHRLEVEITESALLENLALAQSIINSLKNQGIRIALDDFGTGYSSLAHLRALPFDRIKIDRSFVQAIIDNADSDAIVGAVTSLGTNLNLPVTAEGIEDAEIEARVRQHGCTRGQGYLYGRPMSSANTRRLLAERRLLAPGSRPSIREQRQAS